MQRDSLTGARQGLGPAETVFVMKRPHIVLLNSPEQTRFDGHTYRPGRPNWLSSDFDDNWNKLGFFCGSCRTMHFNESGCLKDLEEIWHSNLALLGDYSPAVTQESMLYTLPSLFTGRLYSPYDMSLLPSHLDEAVRMGLVVETPKGRIGPPLIYGNLSNAASLFGFDE